MSANFSGIQVAKSAQDLIYSVSNAIRILGRKYNALKVQVWFNCVYVWAKGQVSRLVSKSKFRHQFVDFRKAGSKVLEVTKDLFEPNTYHVYNPVKDSRHHVTIERSHKSPLQCTCEDYNSQLQVLGKGVCKHGYAILSELGYSSLADYLGVTS
ncbi:hypothetical protein RIF25_10545 [Thermosynechococcaceae cyanobacterium BACA0444]|uniref:SWIM-type domain-containing protein n=1 Tax=Pseudocalidococcus azoricus BACA0444 TaxID=2918990 RepID=A0AAE4FSB0_9CYAN|nr:hypothetical protein [Pseudocalidococcus azoricus]MDS3861245.1 hypothetical protein [Pseudocalidococcus azoricus BACA0444]